MWLLNNQNLLKTQTVQKNYWFSEEVKEVKKYQLIKVMKDISCLDIMEKEGWFDNIVVAS